MVRPSIQIEKKMAFIPPSRMRGMVDVAVGLRLRYRSPCKEALRGVVVRGPARWRRNAARAVSDVVTGGDVCRHKRRANQTSNSVARINASFSRKRVRRDSTLSASRVSACFHASRFTSARDSVNGMSLGQARTQFCESRNLRCRVAHRCTMRSAALHLAGRMHIEEAHLAEIAAP